MFYLVEVSTFLRPRQLVLIPQEPPAGPLLGKVHRFDSAIAPCSDIKSMVESSTNAKALGDTSKIFEDFLLLSGDSFQFRTCYNLFIARMKGQNANTAQRNKLLYNRTVINSTDVNVHNLLS